MAYLRILTGIFDPSLIGDKPKWYCRYLSPIQFKTYEEKSTLAAAIQFYAQESIKSKHLTNNEDDVPTDESVESDVYDDSFSISSLHDLDDQNDSLKAQPRRVFSEDGKPLALMPENQATTMCVDVVSVYSPPVADASFNDLDETSSISSSSSSSSSSSYSAHNENNEPLDDNTFEEESSKERGPVERAVDSPKELRSQPSSDTSSPRLESTPGNSTVTSTKASKSSLSRITQIGDELLSDVANKARHLSSNIKLAGMLSDDSGKEREVKLKKSASNLSIRSGVVKK